jgi:hypothetical protein
MKKLFSAIWFCFQGVIYVVISNSLGIEGGSQLQ